MNALATLVLIAAFLLAVKMAYDFGEFRGRKKARKDGIDSFRETLEQLEKAQEEAGVTPEQMLKINESLTRQLLAELLNKVN